MFVCIIKLKLKTADSCGKGDREELIKHREN
jgi:hypothetical protein